MADKTPVRVVFNSDNVATGLGEFQATETVALSHGGTGTSLSIGTTGQVLRVNAAGTGLEFADQGDVDVIASQNKLLHLQTRQEFKYKTILMCQALSVPTI